MPTYPHESMPKNGTISFRCNPMFCESRQIEMALIGNGVLVQVKSKRENDVGGREWSGAERSGKLHLRFQKEK